MKNVIEVPVGAKSKIEKYDNSNKEFIRYSYGEYLSLDGTTVDSLIEKLQNITKRYGAEYSNIRLSKTIACGCWSHCSCDPTYELVGKRLETDEEESFRMKASIEAQKESDERELAELARLKRKFGE